MWTLSCLSVAPLSMVLWLLIAVRLGLAECGPEPPPYD